MSDHRTLNAEDALGSPETEREGPTATSLFTILWEGLADILGSAATAALLRRAAKRAASRDPILNELDIRRAGLGYTYATPSSWQEEGSAALRELLHDLRPLLFELTGAVVILRLARIPELQRSGLLSPGQEQP